jgi:hypothetical protein
MAGTSLTPNPFGREALVRLDSHGLTRYVWTDSLAVRTYDMAGRLVSRFAVPYEPPRVTAADAAEQLAALGEQGQRTFRDALADSTPRAWPAVRDFVVDDADRVWIALPDHTPDGTEWAVFTREGRYLRSVVVPAGVTLRSVRAGRLYGVRRDENDVPQAVVLTLPRKLD